MTFNNPSTNVHLKNTISVIKNANNKLYILAGCLSSSFSNDNLYIYELSNFIEKTDSHLEILLSNYNEDSAKRNSILLQRLGFYISTGYKDRIIIKQITRTLKFADDEKKEPIYFLLNDLGGYCIDNNNLSEALRFAPQNSILSEALLDAFNSLFQEANHLDILNLFNSNQDDTVK